MPPHSAHEPRDVSYSQFSDHNFINQGSVQGNVYYDLPHPSARAKVVRVIPYPRNEDLVHRRDLIDRLDELYRKHRDLVALPSGAWEDLARHRLRYTTNIDDATPMISAASSGCTPIAKRIS
jgi:hypothetical protein